MGRLIMLMCGVWVVLGVSQAWGAEHLVKDDAQVKAAIAAAVPGDTIVLAPGQYVGIWTLKPGEAGKPITLRAQRAGRVFVGAAQLLVGLAPVAGAQYSYGMIYDGGSAKPGEVDLNKTAYPASPYITGYAPAKLREVDTGNEMRYMATPADVEEVIGSYCYDVETKRLYIHPSDSAGVYHHMYAPIPTTNGITMADHTVVDGLVMTGFGGAAVYAAGVTGATIQNCKLYRNGSAVALGAAKKCVIRNNECWENCPEYSQGAQIFCSDGTEDTLVEGNYVHRGVGGRSGIWFYGDSDRNTFRRNVVWGANGIAAKGHGPMQFVSEFNVSDGWVATHLMHWNTGASSDPALGTPDKETDLILSDHREDPKFVDPAWADCRLQADSPMRGKAKEGKDLGAFQYVGEVVFVKPDGDDKAAGTSVASAWKTLGHAGKNLKAGQTLYILPGTYAQALDLKGLAAAEGQKTLIRAHGKGKPVIAGGIQITGCTRLEVAGLRVSGADKAGIAVRDSQGVEVTACAVSRNQGAGVMIQKSQGVAVYRGAVWGNGAAGVQVTQSADVSVVSNLLGENKGAQIELGSDVQDYYGNFNGFSAAAPGKVKGNAAADLAQWQSATGSEERSIVLKEQPMGPSQDDFRIPAGSTASVAGLYAAPVGPDGLAVTAMVARMRIENVQVISVTRTSANLLWHTPGRMVGTALQWGTTTEYENLHDRTSDYMSEFELVHTVSLINLKPNTTYHFRPGSQDVLKEEAGIVWDDQDYTFTTASEDPTPRQLYVATTGDDSKDGLTPGNAWRTLHKAAREARAGDTVTLAPGRYVELLRPLQTGTNEERRITFRAEKPLSVFLEGGMIKFVRTARPHAVQLHSKAFITIENITGMYCSEGIDYGGYRGGWGYAGIFRVSGGCMNEFKGCVADARYRWMSGFVFFDAGVMAGKLMPEYAAKVTDSATLACWRGIQGRVQQAPLILDHNIYYVTLTGMYSPVGGEKWISRNCIYQDMVDQKRVGPYARFWNATVYDSDYGCFAWMPESAKLIAKDGEKDIVGLQAWQEHSKRDMHSLEHTPDYGITPLEKGKGVFDQRPLTIADFILPKDSPLRGKGENGSDIGVRWEKWGTPGTPGNPGTSGTP